jgi:adenine deaminase
VKELLGNPEVRYLSEMMNFPGVLNKDPEVMEKINIAKQLGKPIDGHAPGLRGVDARQYIAAGISTDHECFTADEALDKLQAGMKILIREGSAARNFDALIDLLQDYPDQMMFCSDDKHPDSLLEGHINQLCARAVARGIDLFHVLQAACINPVLHYNAPIGLLRVGDPADFIAVKDLKHFEVLSCYINGQLVASEGKSLIARVKAGAINHFDCSPKKPAHFRMPATGTTIQPVIEALDGQLITLRADKEMTATNDELLANPEEDILKLVVLNRYQDAPVAKAFIKNFGIKNGALASSVAHDSHNIIAVGCSDEAICRAVNLVIKNRGGLSLADDKGEMVLPLPIAGLMSDEDGFSVAQSYIELDARAKAMGSPLRAPFMTLSFMALLVIPHLKLSDLGLFDGDHFVFL